MGRKSDINFKTVHYEEYSKSNINFKTVHYEEVFIQEKFTQEKLHCIGIKNVKGKGFPLFMIEGKGIKKYEKLQSTLIR
ncbi:unnamed protein product [Medioppia subpectinata]|uniref:Uncharacterized protein n=1 Tax=Medioppia subpectinata TaxID=1979941 RepID=A0A7R9LFH8_9ACAR|nr:unnamed protein product [Medioppia subpectinata]CAG2118401.1 unnamed protein product [Medioppia subpectinata]